METTFISHSVSLMWLLSLSPYAFGSSHGSWPCPTNSRLLRGPVQLRVWNELVDDVKKHGNVLKYVDSLSANLAHYGLPVNTMMIGACDGQKDSLIEVIQKGNYTSAVLVEPVRENFNDVSEMFKSKYNVQVLEAAVDPSCVEPTSTRSFTRAAPSFAANETVPHWQRRQLGSMQPKVRDFLKGRFGLRMVDVKVPCRSPRWLLEQYVNFQSRLTANLVRGCREGGSAGRYRLGDWMVLRRLKHLHVLKMDTEGAGRMTCLLEKCVLSNEYESKCNNVAVPTNIPGTP
jgi:hypothetical protein